MNKALAVLCLTIFVQLAIAKPVQPEKDIQTTFVSANSNSANDKNQKLSYSDNKQLIGRKRKASEFVEAINFVNKLKIRFRNNFDMYKKFMHIIYEHKMNNTSKFGIIGSTKSTRGKTTKIDKQIVKMDFAFFQLGITTPVHHNEEESKVPLLKKEIVQTAPAHSEKEIAPESKEQVPLSTGPSEPKKVPKQSPPKLVDYDVNRVAARAVVKVYGWLPVDKQPKAISDAEAAKNAPKPLGDYDVERVAAKAAQIVYGWLPKEAQPNMNKDDFYADESGADDIKNDQLDKLSKLNIN
uniref:Uncharacterized protein n=1 Tax=Globodera rostochiensis TaxID=31243 RepID=A0A914HMC3_GLORO